MTWRTLRRWVGRLLLASGGLGVGLLASELFLRAAGLAPGIGVLTVTTGEAEFQSSPDPLLRYEPRPGSPGINALGMRDRERQVEKPVGVRRVVVLGDSVAYGFCNGTSWVAPEALFSRRLEDRLGEGVEVLNLGVSGYDAEQEARRLQLRGLQFSPDVVLVASTPNDDHDASMELDQFMDQGGWEEERALVRRVHGTLGEWSHLARWLMALQLAREEATPAREKRVEVGFQAIRRMAEVEGFQVVVALFPDREGGARHPAAVAALIKKAATRRGFTFVDLKPALSDHDELYLPCNAMHPNAMGHAAVAEALAEVVEAALGAAEPR